MVRYQTEKEDTVRVNEQKHQNLPPNGDEPDRDSTALQIVRVVFCLVARLADPLSFRGFKAIEGYEIPSAHLSVD